MNKEGIRLLSALFLVVVLLFCVLTALCGVFLTWLHMAEYRIMPRRGEKKVINIKPEMAAAEHEMADDSTADTFVNSTSSQRGQDAKEEHYHQEQGR
jgi:hypothetical protein